MSESRWWPRWAKIQEQRGVACPVCGSALDLSLYKPSTAKHSEYIAAACTAHGHLAAYRVNSDGTVMSGGTYPYEDHNLW